MRKMNKNKKNIQINTFYKYILCIAWPDLELYIGNFKLLFINEIKLTRFDSCSGSTECLQIFRWYLEYC